MYDTFGDVFGYLLPVLKLYVCDRPFLDKRHQYKDLKSIIHIYTLNSNICPNRSICFN